MNNNPIVDYFLSVNDLKAVFPNGISKCELADLMVNGLTYDCAIPQNIYDLLVNDDFNPTSNMVYVYTDNNSFLFPLTKEGYCAIIVADIYNKDIYDNNLKKIIHEPFKGYRIIPVTGFDKKQQYELRAEKHINHKSVINRVYGLFTAIYQDITDNDAQVINGRNTDGYSAEIMIIPIT